MIDRLRILGLGLLLAALMAGCGLTNGSGPVGDDDDDSGPGPDGAHKDQTLHVVGFGDSVTVGFCAYTGYSYVDLLVSNKDSDYPDYNKRDLTYHYGDVILNNRAINGTTSCNYSEQAIRDAIHSEQIPDSDQTVVLITLGGNDLIHDYGCDNPHECAAYCSTYQDASDWANSYKARMQGFMSVFEQELPNTEIFLANIYDPTDGVGDIENAPIPLPAWDDGLEILDLYNAKIKEVADADPKVHFVDMYSTMMGHGIHYDDPSNPHYDADDPSYWYCYNLEDPNEAGYDQIRRAFWEQLSGVLQLEK